MLSSSESAFRFFCFGLDPVDDTTAALFIPVACGSGVCVSGTWGPGGVVFGFLVVRLGIGAVLCWYYVLVLIKEDVRQTGKTRQLAFSIW